MPLKTITSSAAGQQPARPMLRRRSQSEQTINTKLAALLRTGPKSPLLTDDKFTPRCTSSSRLRFQVDLDIARGSSPLAIAELGSRLSSPRFESFNQKIDLAPIANITAPIAPTNIEKRILFSTPPQSLTPKETFHHRPPTPKDRLLPYTPLNNLSHRAHQLTPAAPVQSAPHHYGRQNMVHPGVLAASEALRINLGLDTVHKQQPQYCGSATPVMQTKVMASPPALHPNVASCQSPEAQLLSSLFPCMGQIQPLGSQSANLPPIVNTGSSGPMKVQPGDWGCLVCGFVNWRRRKFCMRCCPYADGNASSQSNIYTSPGPGRPVDRSHFFAYTGYPVYTTSPGPDHRQNAGMLPFGFMPLSALPPVFTNHLGTPVSFGNHGQAARSGYHTTPSNVQYGNAFQPFPTTFGAARGPTGAAPLPLPYEAGIKDPSHKISMAQEVGRPLTPSPTGSTGSSCSFAFSAGDILSPATTMSTIASPSTPRIVEFGSIDHKASPPMPSIEQILPPISSSQRLVV